MKEPGSVSPQLSGPAAAAILLGAVALDLAFGEPPTAVHPVVWMGRLGRGLERWAPTRGRVAQLIAGCLIVAGVALPFALLAALVMTVAGRSWVIEVLAGALILKSTFAWRALGAAGLRMSERLTAGDISGARFQLRSLCSRDPANLDASALAAATVESLAENASDSFVAPVFYYLLLGVPGAVLYRAVNTLDAMIGYRGRYEYLGKAAARLDDVLNFVPARITAGLLLAAGVLAKADVRHGWRILLRDGGRTASPNAGRPMAAMAGLLRVELAKADHYRLGDADRPMTAGTIHRAWRLTSIAAALTTLMALFILLLLLLARHGIPS
jgi:adenosylcobinamide-phosphate synthase